MGRFAILKYVFDEFSKQSYKYNKIVRSGNKDFSYYFSVKAIIYSLLIVLMSFLAVFLFKTGFSSNNPFTLIFLMILAFTTLISLLLLLIYTIAAIINQFRLNRKIMSFICLLFYIISIVVSFFIIKKV